ncbi:MAG: Gfo/Idh/MocA family protein [Oscillochloridaceae bacterium umkhey_bin13]
MRIALVGCGFVADYYMKTFPGHPHLQVVGVTDRNQQRAATFAKYHRVAVIYPSLAALLADPQVELVVNLTNPRSHYEVTRACLEAGKHVYSEKPLAMDLDQARELVHLAERKGLLISSAPCSLLGETAQTIWRALRRQAVGQVRIVYAEMDEGMVYQMPFKSWISESGAPWPYQDEFEVGTILEHAGYVVTWLPAFFGPALSITGLAENLIPNKGGVATESPDFAVAVIRFASGVRARITLSLLASHDHSLRIFGDKGTLSTEDTWYYNSPVYLRRSFNFRRRHLWLPRRKLALAGKTVRYNYRGTQQMDFARGVADLATAVIQGTQPRLSAAYSLHVNEIVLALSNALRKGGIYQMTTTFGAMAPMPWAQ